MKTSKNPEKLKLWVKKVINSCETKEHINAANNLIVNYDRTVLTDLDFYSRIKIKNELVSFLNIKTHNLIKK